MSFTNEIVNLLDSTGSKIPAGSPAPPGDDFLLDAYSQTVMQVAEMINPSSILRCVRRGASGKRKRGTGAATTTAAMTDGWAAVQALLSHPTDLS